MLSRKKVRKIEDIHSKAFNSFEYITDKEKLNQNDLWEPLPIAFEIGDSIKGDCEEYARAVCGELRRQGFKTRLLYCITETNEGHLACEVEGYILDNRFKDLMTVNSIKNKGYQCMALSGYKPDDTWFKVN